MDNKNYNIMKGKYLFGALFMAILGAFIALFVYTRFIDKPSDRLTKVSSELNIPEPRPILTSLGEQVAQVDLTYAAEQTVHAVVHVRTSTMVSSQYNNPIVEWFYGENNRQPREMKGYGSGVIISPDGYIITNNHVVENAEKVNVTLNDNREFVAQVVGHDDPSDIALLKIKADNLSYIKYGDSDQLRLGEWVLAVGNPFNLTSSVTAGIVSAKGRNLDFTRGEQDNRRIASFIQTDAALNPGNSGGALVNTKGLLVGITSAIISPSGAYAGNSFAIPINIVKKVVDDLRQYGEVQRALIGVKIEDVTSDLIDKENLKLDGVKGIYLNTIIQGGSAYDAGMKEKDVIVGVNGVNVGSVSELQEQVGRYRPGDKVDITYIRNGKENTVPIIMKNYANNTKIVAPGESEGAGTVLGAKLEAISSDDKGNFNIDYGVKVVELNDGRLKDLGIRKGYILLTVNGKKVQTAADVRQVTNNEQNITTIEGIETNGTHFSYQFRR
jgi:Do/DeqQ family serine protease